MPKELKDQKKKRKKKGKGKNYFDQDTEDSIVCFQREPDLEKRKEIFVEGIQPAFKKLIENLINVYGFHSLDDMDVLKNDCMSYLFERIELFECEVKESLLHRV